MDSQIDAGRVAIKESGGYGRPLAVVLVGAGIKVVEVPRQMTARSQGANAAATSPTPQTPC